jgi:hypothetical protein
MPSLQNNTLVVNLETIYLHGKDDITWPTVAASKPISVRVDSVLSQMWLPLEACKIFEDTFDLTWNDTAEAYVLNQTTHERLVHLNPSVTFTISSDKDGPARNFTLPYSAFDLQMGDPPTPYFPLKRANNPVQYMLGRVFLQEVYLIVDYERGNFSLSQAYSTGGSGYIYPIYNTTFNPSSTSASTTNNTNFGKEGAKTARMSSGAYAGIGVSIGTIVLTVASVLLAWKKGWSMFRKNASIPDPIEKAELHGEHKPWIEAMGNERIELPGKLAVEAMEREITELETVEVCQEAGDPISPTVDGLHELHELDG